MTMLLMNIFKMFHENNLRMKNNASKKTLSIKILTFVANKSVQLSASTHLGYKPTQYTDLQSKVGKLNT